MSWRMHEMPLLTKIDNLLIIWSLICTPNFSKLIPRDTWQFLNGAIFLVLLRVLFMNSRSVLRQTRSGFFLSAHKSVDRRQE